MPSDSERIATEATIWLARVERGLASDEGLQLRVWLRQPAQRDAIVEAAKLYHGPDIVAVLAELVPVGFGQPPPPKIRRKYPGGIVIACIVLGVAIWPIIVTSLHTTAALNRYAQTHPKLPWGVTAYSTKPGETRAIVLADGSKITLNSHTQMTVLFNGGLRIANLSYGEVIFRVAPEQERPFEVNAGGRHFQAPHSMFDVRVIDPQSVELLVLNGGVTVRGLPWHWPDTPAEARLFDPDVFVDTTIGPLQAARLEDRMISRYPVTAANARARLQWEPQDIVFVTP